MIFRSRNVWAGVGRVARSWYHTKNAMDKTLYVGPLFQQLTVLAPPNVLQQLFNYEYQRGATIIILYMYRQALKIQHISTLT